MPDRQRSSAPSRSSAASWYSVLNGRNCKPLRACRFLLRYLRVHDVDAVIAAGVAVVMGKSREGAATKQPVVDGPGIDPDADQVRILSERLREAAAHVVKQPGHVPVHRGALAIPQVHRFVGEPGQLAGCPVSPDRPWPA